MIKNLVLVLVALVIGVTLITPVVDTVVDYNVLDKTESFTATETATVAESFTLKFTPDTINDVTVNGTTTIAYTLSGGVLTLDAAESTTNDAVVVNYTYTSDTSPAVDSMVNLLPLLFVVALLAMAVGYVKIK